MRYNSVKNRLLLVLIAVTLLLSLIPGIAYAANDGGDDVVIQPENKPGQPVIAGFRGIPTVDSRGHAAVTIPEKSVADAITKALDYAKMQGKSTNGIGIALNINLPDTAKSLGIVLPQAVLKNMVDAGVKHLDVNGVIIALNLNLEALKEIQKQSMGDVTIAMTPAQNLSSAAKPLIGTRMTYNITLSYVKEGKTVSIADLGRGAAVISLPHTPGESEAPFIPGGRIGQ